MKRQKAQGEIFGMALLFVVIVVGVVIYGQIKALDPETQTSSIQDEKYEILAKETIDSLKKLSTSCEIERGENSLEDLLRYCVEESHHVTVDPQIYCSDESKFSCEHSLELMNQTLQKLFSSNSSNALIAPIPYYLSIVSHFEQETIHNVNITNIRDFDFNEKTYLKKGYKRISTGAPEIIPTKKRNVELEFYLFYK